MFAGNRARAAGGRARLRSLPAILRGRSAPVTRRLRFRQEWLRADAMAGSGYAFARAEARSFQRRKKPLCGVVPQLYRPQSIAEDGLMDLKAAHPVDPRFSQARHPVLRHLDVAGASGRLANHRRATRRGAAPHQPDLLVGIELRGFLVAAPVAYALGCGFAMIRKQGKLPGKTVRFTYDLEYGSDTIEMQDGRDRARPARRRARRSAGDRRHDAGGDRSGPPARRHRRRRRMHHRTEFSCKAATASTSRLLRWSPTTPDY